MLKKYCDRCGLDMTPRKKTMGELVSAAVKDLGLSFSFALRHEPVYKVVRDDEEEVHLCKRCQDAFQKWMKAERPADDLSVKEIDERMVDDNVRSKEV